MDKPDLAALERQHTDAGLSTPCLTIELIAYARQLEADREAAWQRAHECDDKMQLWADVATETEAERDALRAQVARLRAAVESVEALLEHEWHDAAQARFAEWNVLRQLRAALVEE